MLLSAVSVLVVAQSSSEIPEGLMNNPVLVTCTDTSTLEKFVATTYSQSCPKLPSWKSVKTEATSFPPPQRKRTYVWTNLQGVKTQQAVSKYHVIKT